MKDDKINKFMSKQVDMMMELCGNDVEKTIHLAASQLSSLVLVASFKLAPQCPDTFIEAVYNELRDNCVKTIDAALMIRTQMKDEK